MGITEWPGGQWITAGVYWSNEVSNSKLLLIGQGMQTMFFNKSTKLRGLITSQLQQFKNTFDSNRKYIFIKSSIVMTLWQLFCLLRHKYQCISVLVESHQSHHSHWSWKWRKWCAALAVMFHVMLTSIVLSIFSDCALLYHAFQVKSTQIYFDTYFPCISNGWAWPRGLQKICIL